MAVERSTALTAMALRGSAGQYNKGPLLPANYVESTIVSRAGDKLTSRQDNILVQRYQNAVLSD